MRHRCGSLPTPSHVTSLKDKRSCWNKCEIGGDVNNSLPNRLDFRETNRGEVFRIFFFFVVLFFFNSFLPQHSPRWCCGSVHYIPCQRNDDQEEAKQASPREDKPYDISNHPVFVKRGRNRDSPPVFYFFLRALSFFGCGLSKQKKRGGEQGRIVAKQTR